MASRLISFRKQKLEHCSTAMPAINFQLDRVPHARRVPQKL